VALVVSGGHTSIVVMGQDGVFRQLGGTIDDAAGEAFDKIARFIGLPYPGGPEIDRLARDGDPTAFAFPRAMLREPGYDLSLSGLKTAVIRELRRLDAAGIEPDLADVAASFQEAIVDVQLIKTLQAAADESLDQVVLAGGVAANSRLRERFAAECETNGQRLIVPSIPLCTDNGAMVAASGANLLAAGTTVDLDLAVDPNLPLAG
jgi:N6-L-threonylcarbamoyladenine synthase